MRELIVAQFPFHDSYIRAVIVGGSLQIRECPQALYETNEEIWRVLFIL